VSFDIQSENAFIKQINYIIRVEKLEKI
jgi:hypothetical protein